jgi:replicative DNA helicase
LEQGVAVDTEKKPPHSEAAERAVLGTVLVAAPECLASLTDMVAADFYFPCHCEAWEAIRALQKRGAPVNVVSVQDEIRARGTAGRFEDQTEWFIGVARSAVIPESIGSYASQVRKMATLRRLIALCVETESRAYSMGEVDDVLADVRNGVAALEVSSNSTGPMRVCDLVDTALDEIESRADRKKEHVIRTGIEAVDEITGGFRRGHFVVVGGLPSMGKTASAIGILAHNALNRVPCYVVSLEMDRQEVIERILSMRSRVSATDLYTGKVRVDDWDRVQAAAKQIWDWPLWVDDRPMSTNKIIGEAHRWFAKCARAHKSDDPNPIALIVVDYLGLIQSDEKSENRNREIAKMAQGLKALAKELRIPVMALAQLNRKVLERGGEPTMADLRDSGELEAAAQVIMFPWREQHLKPPAGTPILFQPEEAKWIIAKNTGGRRGFAPVLWHRERMEFTDTEDRQPKEPPRHFNEMGERDV